MLMKQQRAEDAVRVWIFHGSGAVHVIHTVWSAEQTVSKLWRLWAAQFYEYPAQRRLVWELLWFILWQEWRDAGHAWRANTWGEKQSHNGKLEKICLFKSPRLIGVSLGIREVGIICGRGKTWERGEKVEGQRKAGGKGNCWWLYLRNEELDRWWWW